MTVRIEKGKVFKLRILTESLWNPIIYKCLIATKTIDTEDVGQLYLMDEPSAARGDFDPDKFLAWLRTEEYVGKSEYELDKLTTNKIFQIDTRIFQ